MFPHVQVKAEAFVEGIFVEDFVEGIPIKEDHS